MYVHRCECTQEGQLEAAGVLFSHSTVYSFSSFPFILKKNVPAEEDRATPISHGTSVGEVI